MLVERVPDPGPAAEVDERRRPRELLAAAAAERDEAVDGEEALVHPRELRADVHVEADRLERVERLPQRPERGVRIEPELRLVVRGLDRLVRLRPDAGREPQEHPPRARARRPRHLVLGVEDDERAGRRGGLELLVRLVVPVEEQPLAAEAGAERELELAEGRDVGAEPLLPEEPQHGHVRKGLDAEGDERVGVDRPVRARLRDERLAAVDDERRPVLGHQLGGLHTAHDEPAVDELRGVRKELEHG